MWKYHANLLRYCRPHITALNMTYVPFFYVVAVTEASRNCSVYTQHEGKNGIDYILVDLS